MALKSSTPLDLVHADLAHANDFVHTHDFRGPRHERHALRMRWVSILSLAAFAVEAAAGLAFRSMALLGEALHAASHAGVFMAAAFAYGYASRHADDRRFSFGPGKVGDLTGFGGAILLGVVALLIAAESVERLLHPGPLALDQAVAVAGFGLLISAAGAWLVREAPHDHGEASPHGRDLAQRAAYLHLVSDVLVSALAVLGLLGARVAGWTGLDSAAGMAGAAVVARFAWTLGREAGARLLDMTDDPALLDALRAQLEAEGDRVVDLHVWRLAPGHDAAIISIATTRPLPRRAYAARIAEVRAFSHLTVEVHAPDPGVRGAAPAGGQPDLAMRKAGAPDETPLDLLAQAG